MEQRQLSAGTKLYFGAPAKPMAADRVAAIAALVARVPGLLEAHLPQCFIEGDATARQLLAVVVADKAEIPRVAQELSVGLGGIVPPGEYIDVLPFRASAVVAGLREAHCQIYPRVNKPWWKPW